MRQRFGQDVRRLGQNQGKKVNKICWGRLEYRVHENSGQNFRARLTSQGFAEQMFRAGP